MTQRNGLIPIAPETPNRRALILSGGGMRVAYQAGVVKALYDAGLRFSYADGTSAGIMNLSALLGGLTPEQLCARWRTLKPKYFLSPRSLRAYTKFPFTGAFGDFDNIEKRVFPHLGVDAERVRQSQGTRSTFNVCDFTDKVVVPVAHTDIAHEQLLAAISLPLATPPVRYQERFWTDAVWIKNANLLETVKAGSNELWVVWYIGNTPTFSDGLLEQYVHMIEMASVGSLNEELAAIADINARIERGERPYGHEQPIKVHIIHPANPIPLDPDFLKGKIDGATLVAYGYRDASRYLENLDSGGVTLSPEATKMRDLGEGVSFREVMRGHLTFGETDPKKGARHPAAIPVAMHGAVDIADIGQFVADPRHSCNLSGFLEIHRLGGWLPATWGEVCLFSPSHEPSLSYMAYDMKVLINGQMYFFKGRKHVRFAGPWRLWGATTTLYVTLHKGPTPEDEVVAAGILRLGVRDLFALGSTLQTRGARGVGAIFKFLKFFVGQLVRIYILRKPA
jgi:Predicted esterase of the alpha-beta hydrolase superfamily